MHTVEIEPKTYLKSQLRDRTHARTFYFRRLHHYKRARIDIKVAARLRCLTGSNKVKVKRE